MHSRVGVDKLVNHVHQITIRGKRVLCIVEETFRFATYPHSETIALFINHYPTLKTLRTEIFGIGSRKASQLKFQELMPKRKMPRTLEEDVHASFVEFRAEGEVFSTLPMYCDCGRYYGQSSPRALINSGPSPQRTTSASRSSASTAGKSGPKTRHDSELTSASATPTLNPTPKSPHRSKLKTAMLMSTETHRPIPKALLLPSPQRLATMPPATQH